MRPRSASPSKLGEVRRDVGDVLIRQRRRLRLHRVVTARAAAIALQRDLEVVGVLAAELRHVVSRARVVVAGNAVTALAGLGDDDAALGVAFERDRHQRRGRRSARSAPRRGRRKRRSERRRRRLSNETRAGAPQEIPFSTARILAKTRRDGRRRVSHPVASGRPLRQLRLFRATIPGRLFRRRVWRLSRAPNSAR